MASALRIQCPFCEHINKNDVLHTDPELHRIDEARELFLRELGGERMFRRRERCCKNCGQEFETAELPLDALLCLIRNLEEYESLIYEASRRNSFHEMALSLANRANENIEKALDIALSVNRIVAYTELLVDVFEVALDDAQLHVSTLPAATLQRMVKDFESVIDELPSDAKEAIETNYPTHTKAKKDSTESSINEDDRLKALRMLRHPSRSELIRKYLFQEPSD